MSFVSNLKIAGMLPFKVSMKELVEFLTENGVNHSDFGKGRYKTIEKLLQEVNSRETILKTKFLLTRKDSNEQEVPLVKKVVMSFSFLNFDVFYCHEGLNLHLYEEKQVFTDGRERSRKDSLGCSLAEKFSFKESIVDGIMRGIREELQLHISESQTEFVKERSGVLHELPSHNYPDMLLWNCVYYGYNLYLQKYQFNKDGYQEFQEDKTTYFKWETVEEWEQRKK